MAQAHVGPSLSDSGLLRLVSLFDPLDTPFGMVDTSGAFFYLNPALENLLDMSGISALGGTALPRLCEFADMEEANLFGPSGNLNFHALPCLDKALLQPADPTAEPISALLCVEPYGMPGSGMGVALCTIQPYCCETSGDASLSNRSTLNTAQPSLMKRWKERIEEIGDSLDITRIGAKVCKLLEDLAGARAVSFWWLDADKGPAAIPGTLRLGERIGDNKFIANLPEQISPREEWLRLVVRQTAIEISRLARALGHNEHKRLPTWIDPLDMGFLLACTTRGDLLGVLSVWGDPSRLAQTGMSDLLELISFQTAQAIDHARWFQFARQFSSRGEQMVENANALILGLDTQGRVTLWNHKCAEVFGYKSAEVLGRSLSTLLGDNGYCDNNYLGSNDATVFVEALQSGCALTDHEATLFDKDGKRHLVIWNTTTLTSPGGVALGSYAIGQDITQRKQLEQGLAASERRYRTLVESTHDLYWALLRDEKGGVGELAFLNRGFAGREREEILAGGLHVFQQTFYGKSWELFERACQTVLETGQPMRHLQTEHATPGAKFPSAWLVHDLFPCYEGQELVGVQGLSSDVTERKEIEAQMFQAQKLESLGTLSRGIAHDFNNILAGIQSISFQMSHEASNEQVISSACSSIQELVKRAAGLTRQLQTYARQGRAEKRPLDLNELIRQSADMLASGTARGVKMDLDLNDNLTWIEADRSQIEQVVMNICLNGVEAMSGKGKLTLRTCVQQIEGNEPGLPAELVPGEYSVLQITDTGCGMPPHVRARIFDPFFTTKSTGNGLGLSSAYGILKAHQAGVKVGSEPGLGSCFTLYFPAAKDSQVRLIGGNADAPMRGGNETILVVDDEEAVLRAAANMLSTLGYRVVTACDGEAALRIFQERPHAIDLVLTDIAMPNLHGRAAAKAMRMVKPDQRFVFTSGYTDDQQIDALHQDGFVHFIGKPYSMIDLQAAIRSSLDAK